MRKYQKDICWQSFLLNLAKFEVRWSTNKIIEISEREQEGGKYFAEGHILHIQNGRRFYLLNNNELKCMGKDKNVKMKERKNAPIKY